MHPGHSNAPISRSGVDSARSHQPGSVEIALFNVYPRHHEQAQTVSEESLTATPGDSMRLSHQTTTAVAQLVPGALVTTPAAPPLAEQAVVGLRAYRFALDPTPTQKLQAGVHPVPAGDDRSRSLTGSGQPLRPGG